jgi:hypothetical protein
MGMTTRRRRAGGGQPPGLPKGPRLLVGALHVALAAALLVFAWRFAGLVERLGARLEQVFYVPVGSVLLALWVAWRGWSWLRGTRGGGG